MYAENKILAHDIYEMAQLFGQKPSDVALLDDCVGDVGRYYFNRGIAAFGRAVKVKVEAAGTSSNATIAQTQRVREFERLLGRDMSSSAAGFRDPGDGLSAHGRSIGGPDDGDDDMVIDGSYW